MDWATRRILRLQTEIRALTALHDIDFLAGDAIHLATKSYTAGLSQILLSDMAVICIRLAALMRGIPDVFPLLTENAPRRHLQQKIILALGLRIPAHPPRTFIQALMRRLNLSHPALEKKTTEILCAASHLGGGNRFALAGAALILAGRSCGFCISHTVMAAQAHVSPTTIRHYLRMLERLPRRISSNTFQ
jgi:hypothetical protein